MSDYGTEARELLVAYREVAEPAPSRLDAIRERIRAPGAAPLVSDRSRRPGVVTATLGGGLLVAAAASLIWWPGLSAWMGAREDAEAQVAAAYGGGRADVEGSARVRGRAGAVARPLAEVAAPTPGEEPVGLPGPAPDPEISADPKTAPGPNPEIRRSSRRRGAPKPPAASDELTAQMALLSSARRALRRGDSAGALRILRSHAQRFPDSQLVGERTLLRVMALCEGGRPKKARLEGRAFMANHPDSPFVPRIRSACPS